jgi:uncharacterized protein
MERYDMSQPGYVGPVAGAAERVTGFLRVVYAWMAVGLTATALVAWMVAGSETLVATIATNRLLLWGIFLAQLGVVIFLSARVQHLAPGAAATLFLLYSGLTGLTFAIILLAYTRESVATTFFVTAGTFGALALYGTTTKRSLSGLGQFLFMGLIGIVIASIVGIFWRNDAFQFVMSFCGVILFTLLTAYDAQRLKAMALAVPEGQAGSYAIVGALTLYLDFINLFLFLLRFLGGRRD